MKDVSLLLPKVQIKVKELIEKCQKAGIAIIITSTYRDKEEQDALYAQGRTKPGNVVTNAKAGQSIHNYKCAFDFVPVINGVAQWSNKALFTKVGEIGESCGLEWGGRWESFIDMPHFQYTAGYTLKDFQDGKVDYTKFDIGSTPFTKMMLAVKEFQLSEGITVFQNELDPAKIRIGPATIKAISKYQK